MTAVLGAALVGCGPNPDGAATTPPTPSAEQSVWALGDSQASSMQGRGPGWAGLLGPAVHNSAWRSSGAGFVTPGTLTGRDIVEEAAWWLDRYPAPERFLVVAGVNDLGTGRSVTEMLGGVDELEALAADAGVEVWYLGYPPFVKGSYLRPHLAERLTFNAALAARVGDRYRSCDEELLGSDGVWLDEAFRLNASDEVHLGEAGIDELTECMAERFGPPLTHD